MNILRGVTGSLSRIMNMPQDTTEVENLASSSTILQTRDQESTRYPMKDAGRPRKRKRNDDTEELDSYTPLPTEKRAKTATGFVASVRSLFTSPFSQSETMPTTSTPNMRGLTIPITPQSRIIDHDVLVRDGVVGGARSRSSVSSEISIIAPSDEIKTWLSHPELKPSTSERVGNYKKNPVSVRSRGPHITLHRAPAYFLNSGDWHEDIQNFFARFQYRGYEPIMPLSWEIDLPTLPQRCFDENADFLCSYKTSRNRAVKTLQQLLTLGTRAREKIRSGVLADTLITREAKRAAKWAEADIGSDKPPYLSTLVILKGKTDGPSINNGRALEKAMVALAAQHRALLALSKDEDGSPTDDTLYSHECPIIFGILILQNKTGFCTLDSSDPKASFKRICHVDFSLASETIWSGFAIMIAVVAARKYHERMIYGDYNDDDAVEPAFLTNPKAEGSSTLEDSLNTMNNDYDSSDPDA